MPVLDKHTRAEACHGPLLVRELSERLRLSVEYRQPTMLKDDPSRWLPLSYRRVVCRVLYASVKTEKGKVLGVAV